LKVTYLHTEQVRSRAFEALGLAIQLADTG